MHYIGIIDRPIDSIFTYGRSGSWDTFYKPDYTPLFEAKFNDPELEEEALTLYFRQEVNRKLMFLSMVMLLLAVIF